MYLWRQANLHEMSNALLDFGSNFVSINTFDTPIESLWHDLRNKLLEVMDVYVPFKTKRNNFQQPWINHNLKQLRRKKQQSYNLARATNLSTHWLHYKHLKNVMQKECHKAFNEYMSDIIRESYENGKKKKLFSYIKSLRTDYCGVDTLQKDGVLYSDNQDKANVLNHYFSTIFTNRNDFSDLPNMGPSPYPDISEIEIITAGVKKLLQNLDPSKSQGPDKIPSKLLKLMASEIAPCLSLVFVASLHQGVVPQDWKLALVTPLFKKGSKSELSNYRPISLTCICSKLLEHIIHTSVMTHLTDYNILSNAQFGFRKNYSAELQLLQTTYDLALNLNNKGQTDVVLLDFSKAFDKVSHQHLLMKLQYYGIRGSTLDWIYSFLSSRSQRVVCGGHVSDPIDILSGVPQGSVLGPLLFLVYINDITNYASSSCRLFADDCILYRKINSPSNIDILQNDLKELENWEKIWKMKFNIEKCMVLTVTLKKHPIPSEYYLYDYKLTAVTKAKYLGVTLDSTLSFNFHIDSICKKVNSVLSFI